MSGRPSPRFDLLAVDGEDLRHLPLLERKARLRAIMPRVIGRTMYVDHIAERGRDFYQVACEHDLEGIVGKWAEGPYVCDGLTTSWVKVKNPTYSQIDGRRELFQRRGQRRPRTTRGVRLDLVSGVSIG